MIFFATAQQPINVRRRSGVAWFGVQSLPRH
jgi:hypothetical protein